MTHHIVLRSALAFVASILMSATAQAQLFRAYLAPTGIDTNPCTLPAPCRLLPAALSAVAAGGEVWLLDSANYNTGPVNITKSVTVLAVPGVVGSVVATGGNAINIATAGVKVVLRNLVIVPLPGGGAVDGIHMTAGAALTVENCLIANLPNSSIYVNAAAAVRIMDTTIRGNGDLGVFLRGGSGTTVARTTIGGNANQGFEVWGSPGTTTTADIVDSIIDGNSMGVVAYSNDLTAVVKISVRNSQIVRNSAYGAVAQSNAGAAVTLSVSNSIISNNNFGISSNSAASKVWASGNAVSDNGIGFYNAPLSLFETAGNNALRNNAPNTSGTITVIAME